MTPRLPDQILRVGVAQMTSTDDVSANVAQMLALLGDMPDPALVDLVVFPENAVFLRVDKQSRLQGLELSDPIFRPLIEYALHHKLELIFGAPILNQSASLSNALVRIGAGGQIDVVYRKIHLFDVDVEGHRPVRESDDFKHGDEPRILEVKGWRLGLSICYDLRFAELYSRYARSHVHALLVPSAFLVPTGRAHWHVLLRARAIESACFVLAPAQGGEHVGLSGHSRRTYGHSLVVEPWGEVMWDAQDQGPRLKVVELDPMKIKQFHRQIPIFNHRRLQVEEVGP